LRFSAPIFVEESVLEKSRVPKPEEDEEKKKLREWLENIKPEDFGKGLG
jgi:bifunctional DNase/RNase